MTPPLPSAAAHLRGASGTPPPTVAIRKASHCRQPPRRPGGRPPYIPLYHSSQGGVPSPRRNSDGNAYVAYTKDSNEAGTYSEVSKTNKLDVGFTANANSTLNGKTGNEA